MGEFFGFAFAAMIVVILAASALIMLLVTDFDFDELSVVVRTLPPYPVNRITTGQFVPGEGRVWGQTVDFADR